jgi:hypothetical protein
MNQRSIVLAGELGMAPVVSFDFDRLKTAPII